MQKQHMTGIQKDWNKPYMPQMLYSQQSTAGQYEKAHIPKSYQRESQSHLKALPASAPVFLTVYSSYRLS